MSGYRELRMHRWMLRDEVRNEAFRVALAHVVKPGDVVLDMGAGTGILSIFAAQAGARRVFAVERTDVAAVARRLVQLNGYADRIEVIQSDLEDARLAEKVDVVVSEWMGGIGVDENMLAPLVMARDRWLKPGGSIIPGRVTALLAPVSVLDFDEAQAYWRSRPHGIELGLLADLTTTEAIMSEIPMAPSDLFAEPRVMWSHDPYTCSLEEADRGFATKLRFEATRAGALTGFAGWFTAEMGDGRSLTNAVGAPDTHWGRTLFPLERTLEITAGTPIEIELRCEPIAPGRCAYHWEARIGDRPPEAHDTRRTHQPWAKQQSA